MNFYFLEYYPALNDICFYSHYQDPLPFEHQRNPSFCNLFVLSIYPWIDALLFGNEPG